MLGEVSIQGTIPCPDGRSGCLVLHYPLEPEMDRDGVVGRFLSDGSGRLEFTGEVGGDEMRGVAVPFMVHLSQDGLREHKGRWSVCMECRPGLSDNSLDGFEGVRERNRGKHPFADHTVYIKQLDQRLWKRDLQPGEYRVCRCRICEA